MGVASNIGVPIMGITFDSSAAFSGPSSIPIQALIVGQKLTTGTGAAETKYVVTTADEVAILGGVGSMVHKMAQKFFKNNRTATAQIIMLADAATATAATQALTVTGPATATGEISLYINGVRIPVSVASGDSADTVGAAIVTAIGEVEDRTYTAAYSSPTVTLTMKNKGIIAGDLDVRLSANAGEALPAGVGVAVATFTAGTVDPDLQDAIDAIGDDWFQIVVNPYTDTTNVTAAQDYSAAQDVAEVQKDVFWVQAVRDTRANLLTYGNDTSNHNSKNVFTAAWYKRLQTTYEGAAALAGAMAQSLVDDVGAPMHRMGLSGITALASSDRWTTVERNQLNSAGIATFDDGVGVQTFGAVTMYLKNPAGVSDPAYQLQSTVFRLMALRYRFWAQIGLGFPRARLADDLGVLKPGLQIITPAIGKTEALKWFRAAQEDGLVDSSEAAYNTFKQYVKCIRSTSNVNRLEWTLPPNMMNDFIVGSADLQFRL